MPLLGLAPSTAPPPSDWPAVWPEEWLYPALDLWPGDGPPAPEPPDPTPEDPYPGGFPAEPVLERDMEFHLIDVDGVTDLGTLEQDRNRNVQIVLNETGSGELEVMLDNPMLPELTRGRTLSVYVYGRPDPVFDFLIEPGKLNLLTQDEEAGNGKVVGGRGTMALLDRLRVRPDVMAGTPVQKVIAFNFSHPIASTDAALWPSAKQIARQGMDPVNERWRGLPAQWTVPSSWWIWSDDGTMVDAPGPATRWFRRTFNIDPGRYVLLTAGDNAYEFFMNGTPVVAAGDLVKTTGAFFEGQRTPIDVPPGSNVFGIKGQNYAATEPGLNPAGILAALLRTDSAGVESSVMFSTNDVWTVFPDLSVGAFPGVTVGAVMVWLLSRARDAGLLPAGFTWDFSYTYDSNHNPWPKVEQITANVGATYLQTFLGFTQQALCDLVMTPGRRRLRAFRYGEYAPASTAHFIPGAVEELRFDETAGLKNAYLVQYDAGFLLVEDAASIAAHGRIEGYLEMGNENADRALERANVELALTRNPSRAQITVAPKPGRMFNEVQAFGTYRVGSVCPTTQEDGTTAPERVTSMALTEQDDTLVVVPTLRDRRLDDADRLQAWLTAMANGTSAGTFQGRPAPDAPKTAIRVPFNDEEKIHQQGAIVVSPAAGATSPRAMIRRSGSARMFVASLSGLGATNVVVQCQINDVAVATATIIAGQVASPAVMIDPPVRVVEWLTRWRIVVVSGTGATDVVGHLVIS